MDWSRAKTILILSFLALNLLLGYELWGGKWLTGESKQASADQAVELNKQLLTRGIRLTANIPKDIPRMKEIVVKLVDGERFNKRVALGAPIRYNRFISKGTLKDLTDSPIEKPEAYRYDPILSKDGLYVMNQMVGDAPLFDVNLELFLTDGQIEGYRQQYVQVENGGEDKEEKKVISAYTALRTLADKYLPNGAVIADVRLGYHGQFYDADGLLVPTWRVSMENGEVYYVHGFRGDVENPNKALSAP